METAISIEVNGRSRRVRGGSVVELLTELGHDPSSSGIAVALNDEVVRRGAWGETPVGEGDRVEIVGAVQGG